MTEKLSVRNQIEIFFQFINSEAGRVIDSKNEINTFSFITKRLDNVKTQEDKDLIKLNLEEMDSFYKSDDKFCDTLYFKIEKVRFYFDYCFIEIYLEKKLENKSKCELSELQKRVELLEKKMNALC